MSDQRQNHPARRVAVVGAGWAGLAAALRLMAQGHQITLFEAGPVPGGRARSLPSDQEGPMPLDNGQHLLIGAYHQTLALMQQLELNVDDLLWRAPLRWCGADACLDLQFARPGDCRLGTQACGSTSPLQNVWTRLKLHQQRAQGLWQAKGLALGEKLALIYALIKLRQWRWQTPPFLRNGTGASITVQQLLSTLRQPSRLQQLFWRPLCLAALNTSADQACAQLFCTVLHKSLGSNNPQDCDFLLARYDLSSVLPTPATQALQAKGAHLRYGHIVKSLRIVNAEDTSGVSGIEVDGQVFDGCVLATPFAVSKRLLENDSHKTLQAYHFEPLPIVTVNLQYLAPHLPQSANWPYPMLQLSDQPERGWFGQWIFDRQFLQGALKPEQLTASKASYTVIISGPGMHMDLSREALGSAIEAQLQATFINWPRATSSLTIREKHATFAATPALPRPPNHTEHSCLWLAGDYTDTGYPATLEGAVLSGNAAADGLDAALNDGL